jgi:hypothetical protein
VVTTTTSTAGTTTGEVSAVSASNPTVASAPTTGADLPLLSAGTLLLAGLGTVAAFAIRRRRTT